MACLVPQQLYSHFPEYGVFKNRTELHAGHRSDKTAKEQNPGVLIKEMPKEMTENISLHN